MVRIPPQYPDLMTWVSRTQDGVDDYGQPNYIETFSEVYGRYENFKGSKKEFLDVNILTKYFQIIKQFFQKTKVVKSIK